MNSMVDWTQLPDDNVIQLFYLLNYRDKASLSSVCPTWRSLAASGCLWRSLDLRLFNFDYAMADSLASRCSSLRKLCFEGEESARAINNLNARNLVELKGNYCEEVTDGILTRIVDMHALLETIQLGPELCDLVSSRGIESIARCCPNLKRLWISGVKIVDSDALNALANNCKLLVDLAFTDCEKLDEIALSNLVSVQFLSIAGVRQLDSDLVIEHWIKFPKLLALDVSRTNVSSAAVSKLLSYSLTLKVLCALNCTTMEQHNFNLRNDRGIELISILTYIPKLIESQDPTIVPWIEQVLSRSFLRLAEVRPLEMQDFWSNQGVTLFINLLQSSQEDVLEITIRGIVRFLEVGGETFDLLSNAFINEGGVTRILNLAKSSTTEGVLFEVTKGITILFSKEKIAYTAAKQGGVQVLINLVESINIFIVEEATDALWSLCNMVIEEDYKSIILECGGLKVLINLLYGRRISKRILKNIVRIIESMSSEKLGVEIIRNGGLKALVILRRQCKLDDVPRLFIARAFAKLTAIGEKNNNNIIVEEEPGVLQALVKLIRSRSSCVDTRNEALVAIWNLSFDERNRESIVAVNSIEALIHLAYSTSRFSWKRWKRAYRVEKPNFIFVRKHTSFVYTSSYNGDVHIVIIEALWNLTFKHDFARRVIDGNGIKALMRLSLVSRPKIAHFLGILVLANIFHVMQEGYDYMRRSSTIVPPNILMTRMRNIEVFIDRYLDSITCNYAGSSSPPLIYLDQFREYARIKHQMKCSGAEIERIVSMLKSSFPSIKSCAAFALMQFTTPGNKNTGHHIRLLKDEETLTILRSTAECLRAPIAAVTFSKIVLNNLEY